MINLDSFFGLELFLAKFEVLLPYQLIFVQLALLISFFSCYFIFKVLLGSLFSNIQTPLSWFSKILFSHTVCWLIVHGVLLLLVGQDISIGRYLYIYAVILIMVIISDAHVSRVAPANAFKDEIENEGWEYGRITIKAPTKKDSLKGK